jgi:aminopeptidase
MTMNDPRWRELAVLFCKATKLKKGDNVFLHAIDLEGLPLLIAFYKEAVLREAGSIVYSVTIPELEHFFLKNAQAEQLQFFPEWDLERMKKMDVFMAARARTNGLELSDISPERVAQRNKVIDPISEYRVKHSRWCLTYVPTDHDAMLAGMSTPAYFDYYFQATLQDYAALKMKNQALRDLMARTDRVTIKSPDTDLQFSIKGIPVKSCHGEYNIPDGEVYTAPIKESVEGWVKYNVPSLYQGREWSNVRLEFRDGKIVDAQCDQGQAAVNGMLDIDEGARYVGEFAIGTNTGIRRAAKNTLFDEKIFGSFHLTPGRAYDEADNGNRSTVHWDLVKILTPQYGGGRIEFDGVAVMEDGLFVHPELLCLNP